MKSYSLKFLSPAAKRFTQETKSPALNPNLADYSQSLMAFSFITPSQAKCFQEKNFMTIHGRD